MSSPSSPRRCTALHDPHSPSGLNVARRSLGCARRRSLTSPAAGTTVVIRPGLRCTGGGESCCYVHGPGGVGKTVLLGEFARLADEAGVPAVRLDGRDLEPSPSGFLAALAHALEEPPDGSPLEALARRPRGVLLVDTYETLAPLTPGCGRRCCPSCPAGTW